MHRPGIGPGPPPWQGEILPELLKLNFFGGPSEKVEIKMHLLHKIL